MRVFSTGVAAYGLSLLLWQTVQASPLPQNGTSGLAIYGDDLDTPLVHRRAGDFYLRIMPLGASIVKGYPYESDAADPGHNGFRKHLRDALRLKGWKVNMVGSQQFGNMNDNSHEGIDGEKISRIARRGIESARTYKPNVILINAGTNDAREDTREDPAGTQHERLEAMIHSLFDAVNGDSNTNNVVIIVSTLLPCGVCGGRIPDVNARYRGVVKKLAGLGKKIILADMDDGFITLNSNPKDIWDNIHPTVVGQKKMAAVWMEAINRAEKWLEPPLSTGSTDDSSSFTCEKKSGSGNGNNRSGWQVLSAANPLISNDGPYRHASIRHADLHKSTGSRILEQRFLFGNLYKINPAADYKDTLDELIVLEEYLIKNTGTRVKRFTWYQNLGGGALSKTAGSVASGWNIPDGCDISGIYFGDSDGDGYDDMLCIAADGTIDIYRNKRTLPLDFEPRRTWRSRKAGYTRENVRLGDIDGDGRLDYCIIGGDGNISCERNGYQPGGERWQGLGVTFTAKGMGDIRGVRFVDINGDGRFDWIWLDEFGKSTIYINQRGTDKSLRPEWVLAASSHGGGFTLYNPGSRDRIQFGRVYGSGRADYMVIEADAGCPSSDSCPRTIHAYENVGGGGRFQKGDGAFWGDMRGRGIDDYIWISPTGVLNLFPNQNTKEDTATHGDVTKGIWGDVYPPINTEFDRRALHIGDWDGDGKDDIIAVEKSSGKLTIWISKWEGKTYKPTMLYYNSQNYCTQGWGVGYTDNGHHFADITGDGRVDYLCMQPDGTITAWINDKTRNQHMWYAGQVKYGEGLDRANFRFADVNGDGKDDMIWVDKFGGEARVWQNIEYLPGDERVSGSKVRWNHIGPRYLQSARGQNIHFPSLGGQGRADMVEVRPDTGFGFAWFNMCPTGGIDDSDMSDPKLPAYTPKNSDDGTPGSTIGDTEFCDGKPQDWNKDLWNRMGMRYWLDQTFTLYSTGDAWPEASEPKGIPSILSEFQGTYRDNRWRWSAECKGADQVCVVSEDTLKKAAECKGASSRAFAIWSAGNYARFIQSFYKSLTDSALLNSLAFGEFVKDFKATDSDNSIGLSTWFAIANGILTSLTAFVSGGTLLTGTAVAGAATIGSSIFGLMTDTEYEPSFNEWSTLTKDFKTALVHAQTVIYRHYQVILGERPPARDRRAADQFLSIIGDGNFVDSQIAGAQTFHPETQSKMITAAVLSGMWNQQQVFAVRFKEMKLRDNFIYDKCRREGNVIRDGFVENTFCVTEDNGEKWNYMILRWTRDYETSVRSRIGLDKLSSHGLTIKEVFHQSFKIQERLRTYGPNQNNFFARYAQSFADQNVNVKPEELVQWTLPVCNWETSRKYMHPGCDGRINDSLCMHKSAHMTCYDVFYPNGGEGSGWPYRLPDNIGNVGIGDL